MKYEVGDRVRIKPKFHFCSVDGFNNINMKDEFFNEYSRLPYCETVMTIGIANKDFYILKEDRWAYKWTDEMIEGLVEEETYDFLETDIYKPDKKPSLNDFMDILNNEIKLPEGYIFKDENGNVINATKIVLEKKKKEYPKTYEECYKVLGIEYLSYSTLEFFEHGSIVIGQSSYQHDNLALINTFVKLKLCRDAYWKIAGEEMGLGKPWEPNLTDNVSKHCIEFRDYGVCKVTYSYTSKILSFPTPEMRDAFYENFDKDLEFCKELL